MVAVCSSEADSDFEAEERGAIFEVLREIDSQKFVFNPDARSHTAQKKP